MRPPGYKDGTPERHCSNCGAFSKRFPEEAGFRKGPVGEGMGYCTMYSYKVERMKACPKWYAKGNIRGQEVRLGYSGYQD